MSNSLCQRNQSNHFALLNIVKALAMESIIRHLQKKKTRKKKILCFAWNENVNFVESLVSLNWFRVYSVYVYVCNAIKLCACSFCFVIVDLNIHTFNRLMQFKLAALCTLDKIDNESKMKRESKKKRKRRKHITKKRFDVKIARCILIKRKSVCVLCACEK